jgi:hypothetical protein
MTRPNGNEAPSPRCAVCKDPRVYDSLDWVEDDQPCKVVYCREHWRIVIAEFKKQHAEIAVAVPDMQKRTKELYRRLQDDETLEV